MKFKIKNKKHILLGLILILSLGFNGLLFKKLNHKESSSPISLVKAASAQEISPLFECPCCGKPIDQCTCPMAKERQAYVDGLTAGNNSEEKAISAYVGRYGLTSFIDEQRQQEFREKLIREAPEDRPVIAINPVSYDFGDVSQKQGIAVAFFEIKNEGKSNLIIDRLESSCGCTSASIVYRGKEGPRFTMAGHDSNEEIKNWQAIIPAGETAQLKIYYDPEVHPDFRGQAVRTVSVFSNDPVDFEKKVQIELNQVD